MEPTVHFGGDFIFFGVLTNEDLPLSHVWPGIVWVPDGRVE
jgi:hypothetical protein